jgi:hypothetical protein
MLDMTIKEWLTPEFFDINVILVTIMINWTLYSIVSNFLEDFHLGNKVQAANYFGVVIMTVLYFILVAVMKPIETLYPNPFDYLLIGNSPVLACIIAGFVGGIILSFILGEKDKIRIGAGAAAVLCEASIGSFTLLWILNQT